MGFNVLNLRPFNRVVLGLLPYSTAEMDAVSPRAERFEIGKLPQHLEDQEFFPFKWAWSNYFLPAGQTKRVVFQFDRANAHPGRREILLAEYAKIAAGYSWSLLRYYPEDAPATTLYIDCRYKEPLGGS